MIYMQNPIKQRYYLLLIEQDLFGTWCLKKVFGSLVSRRGRIIIQTFANKKDAWQELTEIEYVKRQRGYIYVDTAPDHFQLRPQTIAEILAWKPIVKPGKIKTLATTINLVDPNQQNLFAN